MLDQERGLAEAGGGQVGEGLDESVVTKGVGSAVYAAISGLIAWATSGFLQTALGYLLAIAGASCGVWFSLVYRRYLGILAASAPTADADERAGYLALRDNLAAGGAVARLYADRLNRFLAAVERFFGDAGMAHRSLFPHAFGLRSPAPLWTAPAFDRCLLLALVYPIVTIFLIWVISGHVGPAEAALGLPDDLSAWRRVLTLAGFGFITFAFWRADRSEGWRPIVWWGFAVAAVYVLRYAGSGAVAGAFAVALAVAGAGAFAVAGAFAIAVAGAGAFAVAFAVAVAGAFAGAGTFAVAFAIAITMAVIVIGAVAVNGAVASAVAGALAVAGAVAGACACTVAILVMDERAIRRHWQGRFLSVLLVVLSAACLISAFELASFEHWDRAGPLLLFLGLLTLINAPFDWGSLGLTRALLRRGLELGGWWPLLLALVDAAAAALFVALLTMAMVVGIQAFDSLAVLGGGKATLPLEPLFDGIGNSATALEPEYWWVYALLLTTMIPSVINLGIGGASLMRGVPGLPSLLLRSLPADKAVRSYDRTWIALVLALQIVGGVILAFVVQAAIFWVVIAHIMPWFGLGLLDMARGLVALDLPSRAWHLLGLVP